MLRRRMYSCEKFRQRYGFFLEDLDENSEKISDVFQKNSEIFSKLSDFFRKISEKNLKTSEFLGDIQEGLWGAFKFYFKVLFACSIGLQKRDKKGAYPGEKSGYAP